MELIEDWKNLFVVCEIKLLMLKITRTGMTRFWWSLTKVVKSWQCQETQSSRYSHFHFHTFNFTLSHSRVDSAKRLNLPGAHNSLLINIASLGQDMPTIAIVLSNVNHHDLLSILYQHIQHLSMLLLWLIPSCDKIIFDNNGDKKKQQHTLFHRLTPLEAHTSRALDQALPQSHRCHLYHLLPPHHHPPPPWTIICHRSNPQFYITIHFVLNLYFPI